MGADSKISEKVVLDFFPKCENFGMLNFRKFKILAIQNSEIFLFWKKILKPPFLEIFINKLPNINKLL